ncbi:MAG: TnpV protein [Pseudonocardia sp.]|nr:TnpV protein [Pseudonocardia sp.]
MSATTAAPPPARRVTMTDYGAMAQRHWAKWLPQRYSQVPEPKTAFFTDLGRQVELEIEDLALTLEGPDEPGETYLQRVGRMNNARQRAREMILPEQILLTPEPGADPDEEPDPPASTPAAGIPWIVTPDDPEWQEIVDEENRARETLSRSSSDPQASTSSPPPGNAPG